MSHNIKGFSEKARQLQLETKVVEEYAEKVETAATKFLEKFENSITIKYENNNIVYLFNRRSVLDMRCISGCLGKILQETWNKYNKPITIEIYSNTHDVLIVHDQTLFNQYDVASIFIQLLNDYTKSVS